MIRFIKKRDSRIVPFDIAKIDEAIFRAAKELPVLADLVAMFESVLTETPGDRTVETVETICQRIVSELQRQGYTGLSETYLEPHAVEIYTSIRDPELIGLHLMEG